jgi:hypothetical protein
MSDILLYLLPLIIKSVQDIVVAVVDGSKLTEHQIMALKSGYCEIKLWGRHLALDTPMKYDDEAVESVLATVERLLEEAHESLPVL